MTASLLPTMVLTAEQMRQADQAAMESISGISLMEAAGFSVARIVRHHWPKQRTAVLCGPGNNGGDGFVVARHLANHGWPIQLALLGDLVSLKGDAALAARKWHGSVADLSVDSIKECTLFIDALFGTGLTRSITGVAANIIEEINHSCLPVVAVDIPSGLHCDTGAILGKGAALQAQITVTFFRPKLGHLLLPGRSLCGRLIVVDIGITESMMKETYPQTFVNDPSLWHIPRYQQSGHKYGRGHVLIVGGSDLTGAARLSARAARRSGAGLVTIAAPAPAFSLYASDNPGTIVVPFNSEVHLKELLKRSKHINAVLIGPGVGRSASTRSLVNTIFTSGLPCVLDADALSSFSEDPTALFSSSRVLQCVLTPHEGEYESLFGSISQKSKLARAIYGSEITGAVIVLKGADTVITSPNGWSAINVNAPSLLSTAGTGDVLSGLIAGLMAQGMNTFSASCAAVWLHSTAALSMGTSGLIAEDLPEMLPVVLADVTSQYQQIANGNKKQCVL